VCCVLLLTAGGSSLRWEGVISKDEVEEVLLRLGLVPDRGAGKGEALQTVLSMLTEGAGSKVSFHQILANHHVIDNTASQAGVCFRKSQEIAKSVLHCLRERGCLRSQKEPLPAERAATSRLGVSLAAIQALAKGLTAAQGYSRPTLLLALRSICTGPAGEQRPLADLLTPSHVGSPSAFVSHSWSSGAGSQASRGGDSRQVDQSPLLDTLHAILQHYRHNGKENAAVFVWLDVFTVSQHACHRRGPGDLEDVERAVCEAGKRDGTLLVLDPQGSAFTRLWCLLEVWHAAKAAGAHKLHILAPGMLHGPALRRAWHSLDVASAGTTRPEDRGLILPHLPTTANTNVKAALMSSAATDAQRAVLKAVSSGSPSCLPVELDTYATMLQFCTDEYTAAEPLFRTVAESYEGALGPSHPLALSAIGRLAALLRAKGDLSVAEPLCRRAAEGAEEALGPSHSQTLKALLDLAGLLSDRGNVEEAKELFERVVDREEPGPGSCHPAILKAVTALGKLVATEGNWEAAQPLLERSLAGLEARLGPSHPRTLAAAQCLAAALWHSSEPCDHQEAIRLLKRAAKGMERELGGRHPCTAGALIDLAAALLEDRKPEVAEPLLERAVAGLEAGQGTNHPRTQTAVAVLAAVARSTGQLGVAEAMCRRHLASCEARLGPAHVTTLRCVEALAEVAERRGDRATAEALYTRSLRSYEAQLGRNHPHTLASVDNLAKMILARGDSQGAELLYRVALTSLEKKLGPYHPNTLRFASSLAASLRLRKEDSAAVAEAEALCQRAVEGCTAKLGPDHPQTLAAVKVFASLAAEKGDLLALGLLHRGGSPRYARLR